MEGKKKRKALEDSSQVSEDVISKFKPAVSKESQSEGGDGALHLEKYIGRVQFNHASSTSKEPGFYCELCDKTYKDSLSFLDHCNTLRHQRLSGKSLGTKPMTADEVREKLKMLSAKSKEPEQQYDLQERIKVLKEKEQQQKERKKQKKKAAVVVEEDESAALIAETMGFSSFGTGTGTNASESGK